ncbi:MAG: hypothetical protein KA479_08830 [Saprospiraceae bacterium]|nr:hypothetical protein [Saprospiraceae bacterium]
MPCRRSTSLSGTRIDCRNGSRPKETCTRQGVLNENSVSYANEKERSIVQAFFGKKITDFRLIIEVIDCGAQPEMTFARSLMHGLGLTYWM